MPKWFKKFFNLSSALLLFFVVFLAVLFGFQSVQALEVNVNAKVEDGGTVCVPGQTICTWSECSNNRRCQSCNNGCNTWQGGCEDCCLPTKTTCDPETDQLGQCTCANGSCTQSCTFSNGCTQITTTVGCSCSASCTAWSACQAVSQNDCQQTRQCTDSCSGQQQTESLSCQCNCQLVKTTCGDCVCTGSACFKICSNLDSCGNTTNYTQSCGQPPTPPGGGDDSGGGGGGGGGGGSIIIPIPPIIAPIIEPVVENIKEVVKQVTPEPVKKAIQVVQQPVVQTVNKTVIAPMAVAVTAAAVSTSFSLFDLLALLRLLFTEPFWLLFKKRSRGAGTVYNAYSKKPIDLATLRLYRASDKKLIATRVTNGQGQYYLLVEPGEYYLEVTKNGFEFPSVHLAGKLEDRKFSNLYTGGNFQISEANSAIIYNIPLDTNLTPQADRQILREHYWRQVRLVLIAIGPLAAIISFIVSPQPFLFFLVCLHFVMYSLFRRLAYLEQPKNWGLVYDRHNKKPLARAITRIYEPTLNKLLEAQVTDRHGRYGFLTESDQYYLTAQKDGYLPLKTENFDFDAKTSAIIKRDLPLAKNDSAEKPAFNPGSATLAPTGEPADKQNVESIIKIETPPLLLTPPSPPPAPVAPETIPLDPVPPVVEPLTSANLPAATPVSEENNQDHT